MKAKRTDRLNSLLREVISDVIKKHVRNPEVSELITVTGVKITPDLQHAKVHVSVIGDAEQKKRTIHALQSAAGFIAVHASKQIVIRYFPALTFIIDEGVEKQMRIEELLKEIHKEQEKRSPASSEEEE